SCLEYDDGLIERNFAGGGEKGAGLADCFHIHDNAVGARVVAEIIDQVAPAHVEHGSDRHEGAEAHLLFLAPIQNGSAECAALADEGDVSRAGDVSGKRCVEAADGIHHAQAVGTDQTQAAALYAFQDLALQFLSLYAVFVELSGAYDGVA